MNDYLSQLNEVQRQAVECTDGPVMIIAGAGSGKTRVLTYRTAHLIRLGADPFQILALTFTNKAAREMKNRISNLAGNEAKNLWMGTFHSVFARILRAEGHVLGYPSNFTIYDTEDSKSLIKAIVKEQGLDDKVYKASLILNRISAAKNNLYNWQDYAENPELIREDHASKKPQLALIFENYSKRCFHASAMDFDDILYQTWRLLSEHPSVLHKYQHKFKYVMVDEFQDTNYAQYLIVRKISMVHQNICVVGDDAQSIYAFRGANIQNILNFEKDYPELKTFKLEQNYRSSKNIVEAANSLIRINRNQLKKVVWTQNDMGDKIKLMCALSDNEEGHMVAQSIFQDKMNLQLANSDFAILYRTNAQSRSMEEALRRLNIPYRVFGGLSFYQRKEIKDMLAYFRMAINPNDEEALKRIINYPARGIGKTTLDKLILTAGENSTSLWNVVSNLSEFKTGLSAATIEKVSEFAIMVRSWGIMLNNHDAFELASHIANNSGLVRELFADKSPEGVNHYKNLEELLNGIREFSESGVPPIEAPTREEGLAPLNTLDLYLQDIALLTDADNEKDGDKNKVSLMTIHSAKGLEFKNVYVVGMEENLFPSQQTLQSRAELEEERRLFYVAITRAERKLSLSYASTRFRWGNLTAAEPSRFLAELDPEFLDQVKQESPKRAEAPGSGWSPFGQRKPAESAKSTTPAPPSFSRPANKVPLRDARPQAALENFEAMDPSEVQPGQQVIHQRFGKGKVLRLEGQMPDIKAMIEFENHGQRQLLLRFAKLARAEEPQNGG